MPELLLAGDCHLSAARVGGEALAVAWVVEQAVEPVLAAGQAAEPVLVLAVAVAVALVLAGWHRMSCRLFQCRLQPRCRWHPRNDAHFGYCPDCVKRSQKGPLQWQWSRMQRKNLSEELDWSL